MAEEIVETESLPRSGTVEVKADPNVNERLFLTYVLQDLYNQWPSDLSDQQALQNALADLRYRGNRFHEYVKERNFDPKLTALFADFLGAVDTYAKFLADIGRIEREAVARVERERAETGFKAGFLGGTAARTYQQRGATGGQAAVAGLVFTGMQWWLDDWEKGQARNEAKRQAIEAAGRELEARFSAIAARVENTEIDLANKYGWRAEEMRSSDPAAEAQQWQEISKGNDISAALRILDRKTARRPRDAGLLAIRDYVETLDARATVEAMKASADRCVSRASLVPAGQIYDYQRANTISGGRHRQSSVGEGT